MKTIKVFMEAKCGPSQSLKKLLNKSDLEVQFIKLESDPKLVRDLNILATPTTILMEDDKVLKKWVGRSSDMVEKIKEYL